MSNETKAVKRHPNRLEFEGVLCTLNSPSDKSPAGARGHKVLVTAEAAESALETLIGMGVNFSRESHHNVRVKVGVITRAWLSDSRTELHVAGHLFAKDFSETIAEIRATKEMGMSYELDNVTVEDMRRGIWNLSNFSFTGAAVVPVSKAAYKATSFRLSVVQA